MKVIVSDTSVISNFWLLGEIRILKELFSKLLIPNAVKQELNQLKKKIPFAQYAWIIEHNPSDRAQVAKIELILDKGESEAISLALEFPGSLLLIDEKAGREYAHQHGVKITGTLGILLSAKQDRIIDKIRPIVDRLDQELGFRIHPRLKQKVLSLAQEN